MNKDKYLDTEEAMGQIEDPSSIKNKDIAAKEEYWKEKALYDNLTGLPNRLAADLILDQIKDECDYLVVIDIDKFKDINDTYGHKAGDEVLEKLAEYLDEKLIATRFGGEEFVCFLVGEEFDNKEATEKYLNEIKDGVEKLKFNEVDEGISISLGVTEFSTDKKVNDLFKEADKALYCAKDWGRNQVVFYEKGMDCEAHSDDGKNILKNSNCNIKEKYIMNDKVKKLVESINELNVEEMRELNEEFNYDYGKDLFKISCRHDSLSTIDLIIEFKGRQLSYWPFNKKDLNKIEEILERTIAEIKTLEAI